MSDSFYDLRQNVLHDGQSDTLDALLPKGAFVLPAMFVAHLGRGSSGAGHEYLDSLFASDKKAPRDAFGDAEPVMLARDEHVLTPDVVEKLGEGDINEGARVLEAWVKSVLGEGVGYSVDD